ncbi:MAG: dTMP kinase [Fimbriimonadaceae bacterium]|nr:dTMP kinase [Fimbriimonadaceae bacterium]
MISGLFVTFEGPEGAGKSTLVRSLAARYEAEREVLVTREPGAGAFGAAVRRLLLEGEDLEPRAELFLFLADRAEHVSGIVRPALARGALVLCDRHADSTVVYQGYGRGLDRAQLRAWNAFATQGLTPHLTILVDVPTEVGLARVTESNRLDAESLEFHRRVRQGFLTEAAAEPDRWVLVDGTQPLEAVLIEAAGAIERLFATAGA